MLTVNFQMFKLILEKAEEPEIKLTTPKPLTVWIKTNCEKFLEMVIPEHLSCLLKNLYAGQEATVRIKQGQTNWFQIGKGGCQAPGDGEGQGSLACCSPRGVSISWTQLSD